MARWSGGIWAPLSSGMDGVVNVLAVMPSGDLVAGGSFTTAGGVSANRVARWDGVAWSPLGSGVDGVVNALLPMPNGDLIAAGAFTNAGGSPALRIARWNGATWSTLGAGLSGSFPFVAAQALCRLANGDIVAGGSFNMAGGVPANGIARWNGSSWSPLGAGANPVLTLAALPNGHLVAGGAFNQAGGGAANCVARWDGSSWAQLGAGTGNSVTALLRLPNGDLIATGLFDTPARRIARWDGVSWSSFGAGLGSVASGVGLALAQTPNGEVHVAGNFLSAGNLASAYVARLSTTCPATVVAFGAGCVGSGGANVITASSLPWLGAPFAVAATGMPALGLVVEVRGLAAATVPLVSILPQAAVGCSLLATPDWLDVHVPVAGNVATTILAPNTIGLIGQSMVQQFVALELNAWVRSSVSPAPTR